MWAVDDDDRHAAWEMYVELVTRVGAVSLGHEAGRLREALSSLYSLFATTRALLRQYGPGLARPKHGGELSFGVIAIRILNEVVRPLLAEWHPRLADWENQRPPGVAPVDHERAWPLAGELREALAAQHRALTAYADALAEVAGVPPLHQESAE